MDNIDDFGRENGNDDDGDGNEDVGSICGDDWYQETGQG